MKKMKYNMTFIIGLMLCICMSSGCRKNEIMFSIPISGVEYFAEDSSFLEEPNMVRIESTEILEKISCSDVELCWYLRDDIVSCAYRRANGQTDAGNSNEWYQFDREESAYREGFGAEAYQDLFGQDGFCIIAPRGSIYVAKNYYYFDETGELQLLYCGQASDQMDDFNGDGRKEVISTYSGWSMDYYYMQDDKLFTFPVSERINEQLKKDYRDDMFYANSSETVDSHTLAIPFEIIMGEKSFPGRIKFDEENMAVSELSE